MVRAQVLVLLRFVHRVMSCRLLFAMIFLMSTRQAAGWSWDSWFNKDRKEENKYAAALATFDLDGDGMVSLEELLAEDRYKDVDGNIAAQLNESFPKGDSDGDGKLTVQELELVFSHYAAASEAKKDSHGSEL